MLSLSHVHLEFPHHILTFCRFLNVRPSIPKSKPAAKKLFSSSQAGPTQNNMDELLGLCSGQFTEGMCVKHCNKVNIFKV